MPPGPTAEKPWRKGKRNQAADLRDAGGGDCRLYCPACNKHMARWHCKLTGRVHFVCPACYGWLENARVHILKGEYRAAWHAERGTPIGTPGWTPRPPRVYVPR